MHARTKIILGKRAVPNRFKLPNRPAFYKKTRKSKKERIYHQMSLLSKRIEEKLGLVASGGISKAYNKDAE